MPDEDLISMEEALTLAREQIQGEIGQLGDRVQAAEQSVLELRAQFARSISAMNEQLEAVERCWRVEKAAKLSSETKETHAPQNGERAATAALSVNEQAAPDTVQRDAMRFARLLVSEIELYNRTEVAEGRTHKDLYARLKLHIDRSRQAYNNRFGRSAIKDRDYLHEEIVRTLAHNDSSLLGSDYPPPVT